MYLVDYFEFLLDSLRLEREVHPYRWGLHLSSFSLEIPLPRKFLLWPALKFFLYRENKMYCKTFHCFESESRIKDSPMVFIRISGSE